MDRFWREQTFWNGIVDAKLTRSKISDGRRLIKFGFCPNLCWVRTNFDGSWWCGTISTGERWNEWKLGMGEVSEKSVSASNCVYLWTISVGSTRVGTRSTRRSWIDRKLVTGHAFESSAFAQLLIKCCALNPLSSECRCSVCVVDQWEGGSWDWGYSDLHWWLKRRNADDIAIQAHQGGRTSVATFRGHTRLIVHKLL
jgi:hypothetical protein